MKEIKIPAKDNLEECRIEFFGKASFLAAASKGKPDSPVGVIWHGRKKYWVVGKPNRQIGKEPKKAISLKIDPAVWAMVESQSKKQGIPKVQVIEECVRNELS